MTALSHRAAERLRGLKSYRRENSPASVRNDVEQSSSSTVTPVSPGSSARLTCDKCDGPHETDDCPAYPRPRESHKDAWVNKGRKHPREMGDCAGNFKLRHAQVVHQPGDGSCLFHSMSYGLGDTTARALRQDIASFIAHNPELNIADSPLADWVQWDSQCPVSVYARRMAVSGWGGGIEMAACSRLKNVNVHVYERCHLGGFKRISCFNVPAATRTLHVLYGGGVHYDALVPP